MPQHDTSAEQILRCYHLEHREHYQKLISQLPDWLRRDWVAFVEDTAQHCLRCRTDTVVGTVLPGFEKIRRALTASGDAELEPDTLCVVAFSFGANFPFCSLAFQYLGDIWEDFLQTGARFICLFPPEARPPESSEGPIPTLTDEGARCAAHCGLRYAFPEKFTALSRALSWFPGHGSEATPEALTLPGTCVVSAEGRIRDLHIPTDVTRRLPPPAILEHLNRLKANG